MNKYIVLYDTWFTKNNQQTTIIANETPTREQIQAVLLAQGIHSEQIKNVRILEVCPNHPFQVPQVRLWPFTLPCFDSVFARELEQSEWRVWDEHLAGKEERNVE